MTIERKWVEAKIITLRKLIQTWKYKFPVLPPTHNLDLSMCVGGGEGEQQRISSMWENNGKRDIDVEA